MICLGLRPYNSIIIFLKLRCLFLIFAFVFQYGMAQDTNAWFYLRANETSFEPSFNNQKDELIYVGDDEILKGILNKHTVLAFKKTFRNARKENLKKTFFVISKNASLLEDLVQGAPHLFSAGELIAAEDKKIFEPNDYGLTSTIGDNLGAQVNLDYLDYIGMPEAWYYTTGHRDVIVGISDGEIDSLDIEFRGKTDVLRKAPLAKGHGLSVAATAAGQGDNGYGAPGVCYDCSVKGTSYNNPKALTQLLELSAAGAKVINCSWGGTTYYQTAQDAINEMFANGTVLVAIGHNRSFSETKGKVPFYPAAYDNVIAISSGMHRHEKYGDHILKQKELYYAENIRGYVGRTAGFRDNDTTVTPYIYQQSVRNLFPEIDILGPAVGIFRYGELKLHDKLDVSEGSQTSGVAPLISGSIGLMFSLAPCLPVDEVESILKIASTNIDDLEVNKPYSG